MSLFQLIYRSFIFYWKSNLAVILGAAISTMVLTGTLFVGDSVKSSLEKTTSLRLGETEFLYSGIDRYFRTALADELREDLKIDVAPILQLDGIASSQGGKYKLNTVQVTGIDSYFYSFIPKALNQVIPSENEAFISINLADRLQLKEGDAFLLRIEKGSQVPKNAPFVSDNDNILSIRLRVGKIVAADELGRFNLKVSQTAPYNVFLPITFLNEKMGLPGKANKLLFAGKNKIAKEDIWDSINNNWTFEDMALELFPVNNNVNWEIRSRRIFIDSMLVWAVNKIDPRATEILTYMANSIRNGNKATPYSFISAGPFFTSPETPGNEILINSWMAKDLDAVVGDSIEITYYTIGPLRQLTVESRWFTVSGIVPIEGIYAEKDLMPNLPGLSDAGNCRDWEAGVPVSLDRIRDKDEAYWKEFKGTPKAFIRYPIGKKMWANRYGVCTAIRLSPGLSREMIENQLTDILSPSDVGYSMSSVREDGIQAARGGVDFSQLFMGLSFFLLLSGIILMALLFNLHLDKRMSEIGTLKALGYSHKFIRGIILLEGILTAIPGVILGGLLAILYNKLIFKALNTVWFEIVRTSVLEEVVRMNSLLTGMGIALLVIWITIWFNVFKKLKISSANLQREVAGKMNQRTNKRLRYGLWVSGLAAIGLLIYETLLGDSLNTGTFFTAGTLLLLALILYASLLIRQGGIQTADKLSPSSLILKNLNRNSARSLRIIILFSLGTFVIISTGLNRKDMHMGAENSTSGTGGYLFYMETTLPILYNLNDPSKSASLEDNPALNFVQLRKTDGDDASCLNLNRVSSPRILGLPSEALKDRFSFIKSTNDLNPENPWMSLKSTLPGEVIPAIADQTVIQWGLGKKVGDTLIYLDEFGQNMKLKLIGGLANSIFQGNVLIDESHFLKHFPSNSGTNVFLVNGPFKEKDQTGEVLLRAFRNEGLELEYTADRLDAFNQVENTYLSIFLLLGGLAMILGTVGLGVSLIRNILDRKQEIGILRAIGYQKNRIRSIITFEHIILLLIGTISGALTAFIATIPSLVSQFVQASWQTALIIILLIVFNGFIWIVLITNNGLKGRLLDSLRNE